MVVAANLVFNALAGYALTRDFPRQGGGLLLFLSCMMIPFQATIIPAYLITVRLGLLNTYARAGAAADLDHRLHLRLQGGFEAVPRSLIDAARIDGVPDWMIVFRIMLPLTKPAIATNVILSFIWSWNNFLWPLIIIRDEAMQTLPLGLSRFLTVHRGHDRRALRLLRHGAGAGASSSSCWRRRSSCPA